MNDLLSSTPIVSEPYSEHDFKINKEAVINLRRVKIKENFKGFLILLSAILLFCTLLFYGKAKTEFFTFLFRGFTGITLLALIPGCYEALGEILQAWRSSVPNYLIKDNFIYIPFKNQKISLDRIKQINLEGEDISISYIPLKNKDIKIIRIPLSVLQNRNSLLTSKTVEFINARKELPQENIQKETSNLFFDISGAFFSLLGSGVAIIMSLWPLWLFVIMLLLIFK